MKQAILIIFLVLNTFNLKGQDSFTLNEAVEFGLINNSVAKKATNVVLTKEPTKLCFFACAFLRGRVCGGITTLMCTQPK